VSHEHRAERQAQNQRGVGGSSGVDHGYLLVKSCSAQPMPEH
jgi:hypothetical protein